MKALAPITSALILIAVTEQADAQAFSNSYVAENRGTEQFLIPETYELANVILSLTPYGRENKNRIFQDSAYYRLVQQRFGRFKDHPLITGLNLRSDADITRFYAFRENAFGFRFDGSRLVRSGPYKNLFGKDAENEFARLRAPVESFAQVSDFRGFYAEQQPYYRRITDEFRAAAPLSDMVTWLETAFGPGYRYDAYKVIFSPLVAYSHSSQKGEQPGFRESLMFVGAPHIFGSGDLASAEVARMLFTEIDHNFVNPTSDRFRPQIDAALTKLCFWNDVSASGGYASSYDTFNEYMTWALFSLWADQRYPDRHSFYRVRKLNRYDMLERGFPQFTQFDRALARAYGSEKRSIPDIYPEIIAAAKTLESERGASVTCKSGQAGR